MASFNITSPGLRVVLAVLCFSMASVAQIARSVEKTVQLSSPEPNTAKEFTLPDKFFDRDATPFSRPGVSEFKIQKPKQTADPSDDSGWHFAVAPYLFATGISGTVAARGRSIEVDSSFGNIFDRLDVGFMGAFEARKGRLVSFNDLIWTKLSAERDTPGQLFSNAKVGINLFIFDPEVGYRLVNSEKGSIDVLGGVRIWSVETNLNVTSGVLPGFDVSQRKTWAAPVVGVHGVGNITRKFFVAGKFDIGGAGIGADLTTQLYGAAGYRLTKHVALLGGYRWLQVDYDDEQGFLFDTQMSGLMFGAKFSF
jgi:hypothetical protein